MSVMLNCPACMRRLSIPTQHAGQWYPCPACGKRFLVPGGDSRPLNPAQTGRLVVLLAIGGIFLATAVAVVVLLARAMQAQPPAPVADAGRAAAPARDERPEPPARRPEPAEDVPPPAPRAVLPPVRLEEPPPRPAKVEEEEERPAARPPAPKPAKVEEEEDRPTPVPKRAKVEEEEDRPTPKRSKVEEEEERPKAPAPNAEPAPQGPAPAGKADDALKVTVADLVDPTRMPLAARQSFIGRTLEVTSMVVATSQAADGTPTVELATIGAKRLECSFPRGTAGLNLLRPGSQVTVRGRAVDVLRWADCQLVNPQQNGGRNGAGRDMPGKAQQTPRLPLPGSR
jgi:outer membrane biosynthesis protein TonB